MSFEGAKQSLSSRNRHQNVLKSVLKSSISKRVGGRRANKGGCRIKNPGLTKKTPKKKSFEPGSTYTPLGTNSGKKYYETNPLFNGRAPKRGSISKVSRLVEFGVGSGPNKENINSGNGGEFKE
jgi:hypothetical protein